MRLTLLFSLLLCSPVLFAQKFALIENKGAYKNYFDQNNPNSFIGVLLNNIDFLPTLIDQNNYKGVYNAFTLEKMGVSTSTMLSTTTAMPLLFTNNETNQVDMLIKTRQTLNDFIDSIKEMPAYDNLRQIDRDKLQEYWDKSCVDCPVHLYSTFYFDIRHTEALLIENRELVKDSLYEKWVHFIGGLPDGKRMITLSLRTEQLTDNSCFKFLQFLDKDLGNSLRNEYKKQAFYQSESELCRKWRNGDEEAFMSILDVFDIMNDPPCWSFTTSSGLRLIGVTDSENLGSLHQQNELSSRVKTIEIEQTRGCVFYYYSFETGDSIYIIKTNESFQDAYQTLMQQPEFIIDFYIDSTELSSWWKTASLGDTLRQNSKSVKLWKDEPNTEAAVYFQLSTDEMNVPKADITDVVFYTTENTKKEIYLRYNFKMAKDHEEFDGAILKELNRSIQYIELYLNSQIQWNPLQATYKSKYEFSQLQYKLNLINVSTEF